MKISIRNNPEYFEVGKVYAISNNNDMDGRVPIPYTLTEVTPEYARFVQENDENNKLEIKAEQFADQFYISQRYNGTPYIPSTKMTPIIVSIKYEVGDFVCCAGRDYEIISITELCGKPLYELKAIGRYLRNNVEKPMTMFVTHETLIEYGEPLREVTHYEPRYLNGYMRNMKCYEWEDEDEEDLE